MWNLPSFISSIFSLFFPCSPSLRHPLHDYGSKCEALIKPWLLCFKGLALSHNFPCVTTSESGSVRFPFQPAESQKHQRTITTFLKRCLRIPAFVQHMARQLSCAHRTKGWLFAAWIKWKTLWAFVEKSEMTLSLGNPDITQTACYAHDWFQWLK